jgi:hypothetical protein
MMAVAKVVIGRCGPFVVVPLIGALTVWLTYVLGKQVWSSDAGLVAAALMATSPAFLYMVMNPMTDVAVTGLFLAGLVAALSKSSRRAFWSGLLVSAAIFVRPNLVPVGAVFLVLVMVRASAGQRWRAFAWFGAGGLPLIAAIAAINAYLYGAPWRSGYGSLEGFYAWGYLGTNLRQYSTWLLRTETVLVVLALVPFVVVGRADRERHLPLLFVAAFGAAAWLCYLFYAPFEHWWYLRFLLPSFPVLLVLTAIGLILVASRWGGARRAVAVGLLMAAPFFALRLGTIHDEQVFRLWHVGIMYTSAAEYVKAKLPANAVIVTILHSGTVRYYSNRLTMRWDYLGAEWWPRAVDVLVERGYRPYVLLAEVEEKEFRTRFGLSDAPDAPGTVVAMMDVPDKVRIYDPLRLSPTRPDTIPVDLALPCGLHAS